MDLGPLAIEGVEPGQSTERVLRNYLDYVFPALLSRASHPMLLFAAIGCAASWWQAVRRAARVRGVAEPAAPGRMELPEPRLP